MGNQATTIDEQIRKLQSRGMEIDCGLEKAKEHLFRYRVLSFRVLLVLF